MGCWEAKRPSKITPTEENNKKISLMGEPNIFKDKIVKLKDKKDRKDAHLQI